jgi:hypothetical protein
MAEVEVWFGAARQVMLKARREINDGCISVGGCLGMLMCLAKGLGYIEKKWRTTPEGLVNL